MRRVGAAAVALPIALVGCGSNSAPATAPTKTGAAKALPLPATLRTALVTAEDVGAGWTEIDLGDATGDICGITPLRAPRTTTAAATFGRTDDSAVLVRSGVTAYPAGGAAKALSALRTATADCSTYQLAYTDAKGAKAETRVEVAPLDIGSPGDDRLALTLTFPERGAKARYAVIRRGNTLAAVARSGSSPTTAQFSPIVAKADERLAVVAP